MATDIKFFTLSFTLRDMYRKIFDRINFSIILTWALVREAPIYS